MTTHKNLLTLCVAAVLTLGLAACGGDGGDDPVTTMPDPTPPPDPGPTAYEAAKAAIAAATTPEAAQAAYDAALGDVTGAEAAQLQTALDTRLAELMTMARAAEQRMALMTAAGMIDTSDLTTQAQVDAAEAAIAGLEAALAAATDVSDADKAVFQGQVTAAETAVAAAQSALDHAAQTMALMDAVTALQAIDLTDLSTQEKIDAANTAIAALQTALDGATELSASEKTAAMTELATADRTVMMAQGRFDTAAQKTALADAVATLADLDLDNLMTQEQIDAAVAAITGVRLALDAATHLTDAEKLNATVDVTVAQRKVDRAETDLAENVGNQRMALTTAGTALAAIDLADLSDQAKIDAAQAAVDALKAALDDATHLSDSEKAAYQTQLDTATETVRTAQTGMDRDGRMMTQRNAITTAVTMATTAVGAVNDTATDAQVTAADNAIAALEAAIEGADDLPDGDTDVAMAMGTLNSLKSLLASAKTSRTTAMAEEQRKANEAMAVTAARLYDGIAAQTVVGAANTVGAGTALTNATDRAAAYNDAGVPSTITPATLADTRIMVGIGTDPVVALSEDKKTTVASLHGWEGKRYTAEPDNDGMYEAVVYSNVGDPEEGKKFGSTTAVPNDDFEYQIDADGEVAVDTATEAVQMRVASPSFDQGAGSKEFELPTNTVRVMVTGTYHGVSGTYFCTPAADSTCASRKAAQGFELGSTLDATNVFTAGGWVFKPTNAEARVMSVPDSIYASYGWWIHRSEDGSTFTASTFVDNKGAVPAAAALDTLQGTATYRGGAAGKYALSSSTGGTNDAGHFTARATLEADFSDNSITGTVDQFMGADGESRDWSVELKEAAVGATGGITRTGADQDNNDTVWTIDGTAADASGSWAGTLYDNGDDGVPKVGTGTFDSTYGTAGKMVGAFGANKQ